MEKIYEWRTLKMNNDDNFNEEVFELELQESERFKRNRSRKIIKSAEKKLTKIFLDQINGKVGDC